MFFCRTGERANTQAQAPSSPHSPQEREGSVGREPTINLTDDDDEEEREASNETPWIRRRTMNVDCIPLTPRRKVSRGLKRAKPTCVCDALDVEKSWNAEAATFFHSQLKQEKYESWRHELTAGDVALSSKFIVGRNLEVQVCLMKDRNLVIDEKVILVISSGQNELRFPAVKFLERGVPMITEHLCAPCKSTPDREMMIPEADVYFEIFADSFTKWICFREYVTGYVTEKLYMSAFTWVEFKRLVPLLMGSAVNYTDLVLQDRAHSPLMDECYSNVSSPTKWHKLDSTVVADEQVDGKPVSDGECEEEEEEAAEEEQVGTDE